MTSKSGDVVEYDVEVVCARKREKVGSPENGEHDTRLRETRRQGFESDGERVRIKRNERRLKLGIETEDKRERWGITSQ